MMTMRKLAPSFLTTKGGSQWREQMDLATRAEEILALAQASGRKSDWLQALPSDVQSVLVEIRDRWEASRSTSGVSAAALARTIISQMPEYKLPRPKGLAEWLNRRDER